MWQRSHIRAQSPPWADRTPLQVASAVMTGATLVMPDTVDEKVSAFACALPSDVRACLITNRQVAAIARQCWQFEPKARPTMKSVNVDLATVRACGVA
jgi:hypothetical protein